jgi:hypothetical protein
MGSTSFQVLIGFCEFFLARPLLNRISIIIAIPFILCEGPIYQGEKQMNKTLIVLGAGIWGVLILLRFVLSTIESNTLMFLNIIEIVAFVITIVGIVKRE